MKPISCLYIFILLLLLSICPVGNNHAYAWVEGKELAVVPASKETIEILNESGVDIEQIYEGKIRIWATREELDRLTQLGIPYIILHDEMQAERNFYNQWKSRRDFMFYTFGTEMDYELDYHSYNDMVTALRNLEANYPSICKMVDVGDTVNGRDIWAVVISDNVNIEENEPEVKLEGGIHGDEWSATEVPIDIAKYLCQNYSPGSGNDASFIVDNLETWIIPMRNADGHESNSRLNARGIDLNRNFDGPTGCSWGNPSCFSEPETQSVRSMFEIMGKRFCLGISYHSGAQCFSSVWSYDCIAPPDEEIFWHNRTTCNNNSGYFNEIPAPDGLADAYDTSDLPESWGWTTGAEWYVVTGGDKDYSYWDWGMLITTIECTKTKTPATSEIQSFLAWHRQPTLNYLKKAMQGIHGLVTNAETGQPLDAKIEIQGKSIPIFTDPDVGDYHRILMPGTYTVIASANGYVTKTLPGITVTADSGTIIDIRLMGAGSPPPPPPPSDSNTIWIEAENGDLHAPMQIETDFNASSGEFIWVPTGNGGYSVYSFNVPESGNYYMWGRVLAPHTGANSFYIASDSGTDALWDIPISPNWKWDRAFSSYYGAGQHTIVIKQRERRTQLDRILITKDPDYVPIGMGGETNPQTWLEAENGDLHAPMQIEADINASSGEFIWVPAGDGGYSVYSFNAAESGNYYIWGRVLAPNSGANSFYLSVDNGGDVAWHLPISTAWNWDQAASSYFNAGTHTITIKQRERRTQLDRILITKDPDYVLSGMGGETNPQILLEAENGDLHAPMQIETDINASSGEFIWVPTGNGGYSVYVFNVPESGNYFIWGRVLAPHTGANSFYIASDSGTDALWDIPTSPNWKWDKAFSYYYGAGQHTIIIKQREFRTQLDSILITKDQDYVPNY